MGYFDGLTDAIFKKDTSGNTLFFPWGVLSSGVVIDTEEKKDEIKKIIKNTYIVMIPIIIIIQLIVGYWLNLALLPFFTIWYIYIVKKITKDLPRSQEKLKLTEAYKNSAKSHNLLMLVLLELSSLFFVAIGVWMALKGAKVMIAYLSIVFFGLCSISIGYMTVVKLRKT
jgi:hypothetical protein